MTNSVCTFMIDSGADVSVFKANKILGSHQIDVNRKCSISGISGEKIETLATTVTALTFSNTLTLHHEFHLVGDEFPIFTDGILGRDFLSLYKCTINYEYWILSFNFNNAEVNVMIEDNFNEGIIVPERCEVIRRIPNVQVAEDSVVCSQEIQNGVFCGNTLVSPNATYVKFINTTSKPVLIHNFKPVIKPLNQFIIASIQKGENDTNKRIDKIKNKIKISEIPSFVRTKFEKVLEEFNDIFALDTDNLTTNNFYEQSINLTDNVPVYTPNYRSIHAQNDEIESQVKKLLENNIIENSVSAYNSPILLVPKKSNTSDKKWRLVVDFRQLNKKILADRFPLPRIDTILDQLGRAKYFSTLDLMAGFHQIPLSPESRKYTAFSTPSGHYAFTRLPFGLNVSPNSFQRMMTIAMAGLTPECAFVYIDDIVVIGCSAEHHIKNLINVFKRLRHYNLKLNPEKCQFFKTEVTYLGHKITDQGILPDDTKFEVIKNYPIPTNADETRRFVAFCNYYRKFVPDFARLAKPLNDLLKKNSTFEWTDNCQSAFEQLRNHLLSPPILSYPDFSKKFYLTTDASNVGCGAILSQVIDGQDLPIAYASKAFNSADSKKPTIMQEMIAIHWAIDYFKPYLYGRKFIVRTDHRPLVFLFGMKEPTKKLTQMRLDLEDYDFEIEHIKGTNNVGADALSRLMSSDDLKNRTILMVNTRSMTKKKSAKAKDDVSTYTKPDQLLVSEAVILKEARNSFKLTTNLSNNIMEFQIKSENYKKTHAAIQFNYKNESQTLESALSKLNEVMTNLKIKQIALSLSDPLFSQITVEQFKSIATKIINSFEILLFKPPRQIESKMEVEKILHDFHNSSTGGHIGQHRLYLKLRDLFQWRGMKGSIAKFIKACEFCRKNKVSKRTKEASIITSTPQKPFDVISIDTVGPLPKTSRNNRYCITLQCDLSKFVIIIPIQNKESNTIARALVEDFILKYGNFLELRSDRGTEYCNEVLQQISKILNFKQTFSAAYHPETIGALERNHRCLNEYLRSFSNEHHDDWDDWVGFYTFVYNTTPHTDSNLTPFELVYGRKPNLPQDLMNNRTIEPVYNIEQYMNELKFKLQKSQTIAREHMIKEKIQRTADLNINLNPIDVSLGDLVYITKENRKKLDSFYTGPYKVIETKNSNCVIEDLAKTKKKKWEGSQLIL